MHSKVDTWCALVEQSRQDGAIFCPRRGCSRKAEQVTGFSRRLIILRRSTHASLCSTHVLSTVPSPTSYGRNSNALGWLGSLEHTLTHQIRNDTILFPSCSDRHIKKESLIDKLVPQINILHSLCSLEASILLVFLREITSLSFGTHGEDCMATHLLQILRSNHKVCS